MRILGLGVGLHTCDTLVSNDLEAVQVVDFHMSCLSVRCLCATIKMFIVSFNMLLILCVSECEHPPKLAWLSSSENSRAR